MGREKKPRPRYSTHKRIRWPEIASWLRMVERGEVPACADQLALCAHVRRVFADERLWVDEARLARYIGYQEHFPFELAPEEEFVIALWLCTYRPGHFPRWPDLFFYVGRGYGKTAFMAFCAFCLISPANGVRAYDVDVCATTEDQAKLSYDDLWRILEARPDYYRQQFDWNKLEATCLPTSSRFKYWSGNAGSKDGMRSGAVFFDEVHAYADSASMEVFTGGLGKKPDARRGMFTTDGDNRGGVLDEHKEKACAILAGERPDGGLLPFMCRLDSIDEAGDEPAWPKANPRLLRSPVLLEEYRKEVAEWRERPARHPMTPTKRFNLPQGRTDVQVTSWENLLRASRDARLGELLGHACVAGIDYAKTTDMVGACLLFREGREYRALVHGFWCTASRDAGAVKAPLAEWAEAGWLTVVDDVEVPPSLVVRWLMGAAAPFDLVRVCMDSYRQTLFREALADAGFDVADRSRVKLARPSDQMLAQPVIESAFANGLVAWGDNPLARWAANNAKLEPCANGNYKYGKVEPHGRKTDPFMAFVHAVAASDDLPSGEAQAFFQPIIL